jgi:diguanylate cyclase (GGDEF)-like protein
VAERMRRELAQARVEGHGPEISLRASFGVATFPPSGPSVREVLLAADQALYRAKGAGGDCVRTGAA